VHAGDGKRIARIADRLLDEYITNGEQAFTSLVDEIPVSLLDPSASHHGLFKGEGEGDFEMNDDDDGSVISQGGAPSTMRGAATTATAGTTTIALDRSVFSSRLAFLARYRDFHALYARGELSSAFALLVSLLANNAAPKRFQAVMLLDSMALLEGEAEAQRDENDEGRVSDADIYT
jgi:nuclear pore complex protein Nup85